MRTGHSSLSIFSEGMRERESPLLMLGVLDPHSSWQSGSIKPRLTTSSLLRTGSPPHMSGAEGLQVPMH